VVHVSDDETGRFVDVAVTYVQGEDDVGDGDECMTMQKLPLLLLLVLTATGATLGTLVDRRRDKQFSQQPRPSISFSSRH
jgi:hypothetical protein